MRVKNKINLTPSKKKVKKKKKEIKKGNALNMGKDTNGDEVSRVRMRRLFFPFAGGIARTLRVNGRWRQQGHVAIDR